MLVHNTLSTAQWSKLQSAFDTAVALPYSERMTLLDALAIEDQRVAQALGGMLEAAERWRGRTGAAQAQLREQAQSGDTLQPGDLLGRYRILGELGRGGMGRVYLGERTDGQVQQQVAIKLMRPGELDDTTRDRFRLERALLAGFNHRNIARLFDAGERESGEPYFVMEYIQGQTIHAYCDEHKLDIPARLKLFLKVCDAVRYAHSKLVLHRDLKPGNILVDEHGEPKLIDFGIAKSLSVADASLEPTATQGRFFSPLNAAPEQLRGEAAGLACDVYQLGTVLYELLCGHPIFSFEGTTPAQIEENILQRIPLAPSVRAVQSAAAEKLALARACGDADTLARRLRGDLDEIVLLALRKEPDRRYASVEQLSADIERHLADLPVRARGQQGWYAASRFAKRNWRGLSVAALGVLLVSAFVATLGIQARDLRTQRDRAVIERQQAQDVTSFLVNVFKAADPGESKMRDMPIGIVVDNARKRLESDLADAPESRSRILLAMAEVYAAISDTDTAHALAAEALGISKVSADMDPRERIAQLNRAWSVYATKATNEDALALVEQALEIHDSLGDPLALSWRSRLNRSISRHSLGHHDACAELDALVRSLSLDPATRGEPFATAAIFVADCNNLPGRDLQQDTRLVQEGVAKLATIRSPDDPEFWQVRESFATMLRGQGRDTEALEIYEDIAARRERLFGPDSYLLAVSLFRTGALYSDLDRVEEAESAYLKAMAIFERTFGDKPHPSIAVTSINLANLYDEGDETPDLDERAKKAKRFYLRALAIAEPVFGEKSNNLAAFRVSYGDFQLRHGETAEAKVLFNKVIGTLDAKFANGMRARARLALILFREGDFVAAEELIRECEAALKVEANTPERTIAEVRGVRESLDLVKASKP